VVEEDGVDFVRLFEDFVEVVFVDVVFFDEAPHVFFTEERRAHFVNLWIVMVRGAGRQPYMGPSPQGASGDTIRIGSAGRIQLMFRTCREVEEILNGGTVDFCE